MRRTACALLVLLLGLVPASAPAAEARARNVILFVGDGMGVSTLTAARIFDGQRRGVDGASNRLSFERFPSLALVQTYSADGLVTDSAAAASALMTGHRTVNGALGVDGRVVRGDCASSLGARVVSIAELAKAAGRATGAVSTADLADATPAALYAHTPSRSWQSDAEVPADAKACRDIALQMVDGPADLQLDLMLGGGRSAFRPADKGGRRRDGRDLVAEWTKGRGAYVETGSQLSAAPKTGRLLGLFAPGNMPRESERQAAGRDVPRLVDMTRQAIERLSRQRSGYFLMVEGGLIDKSHHVGLVQEALNETVELAAAVEAAAAMTDPKDTLILVVADHSHGLTINGGGRNTSILGYTPSLDDHPRLAADGRPIPILMYATGPGAQAAGKPAPTEAELADPRHQALATLPLPSAAHTGEDVALYARGPGAAAIHGLMDQPGVFAAIKAAMGL